MQALCKLLVIDDDPLIHQSIALALPASWTMVSTYSLRDIPQDNFTAAIVDLHLSRNLHHSEGLKAIAELTRANPHLEVIAMSGDLNIHLLDECLRAGAFRFLPKPLSPEELQLTLEKIEALVLLKEASLKPHGNSRWLGQSSASEKIQRQIAQLKSEPGPVLIEGESGTGKEVVANSLHQQESPRPWVQLNVAAIPDNLFESELFGHNRGAFTGADQNKMGLAELAHNGDLFLDEIEALPLEQQAKLLRFLESGEVRRLGAKNSINVKVRVIAATNKNLNDLVREGKFREDLLWRLEGKKVLLPPLRDRKEDIPLIAQYFIDLQRPRYNKLLDNEACEILQSHQWPGNVRELKRICEQLCLSSPLPIIRASDVKKVLPIIYGDVVSSSETVDLSLGLAALVSQYEGKILKESLKKEKDVDSLTKLLKVSRSTLYKKLKDFEISL